MDLEGGFIEEWTYKENSFFGCIFDYNSFVSVYL